VVVLVREHDGMERAAAWIADTDPDGQSGDVGLRARGPAERVRGQLAARSDELAECAAVHARGRSSRHLGERTLQYLDVHPANLADLLAGQQIRQDIERVRAPGQTCGIVSGK
jgi:hypothetical protein